MFHPCCCTSVADAPTKDQAMEEMRVNEKTSVKVSESSSLSIYL